jgi:hypothetical protein
MRGKRVFVPLMAFPVVGLQQVAPVTLEVAPGGVDMIMGSILSNSIRNDGAYIR